MIALDTRVGPALVWSSDALDAQIAAICLARGAALATRSVRDFEGVGLEVVDPWTT